MYEPVAEYRLLSFFNGTGTDTDDSNLTQKICTRLQFGYKQYYSANIIKEICMKKLVNGFSSKLLNPTSTVTDILNDSGYNSIVGALKMWLFLNCYFKVHFLLLTCKFV
uniref:Uncharacterized protein n=1 Tax=Lepeophtheirus salmonis TaxID=72036 RepID=A0A0K2VF79_LEPSM